MPVKGDKLIVTKKVAEFLNEGEICEVIEVNDRGIIKFSFGNGIHMGIMSTDEFDEYFEKYEEPKKVALTVSEDYINWIIENSEFHIDTVFDKCTVMSCKLPNGFVIVESSACVDPDNYNEDMGIEICTNKIVDKIWELEGYVLQQKIWESEEHGCCTECCCDECDEIDECLDTDLDCDDCDDYDCPYNTNN